MMTITTIVIIMMTKIPSCAYNCYTHKQFLLLLDKLRVSWCVTRFTLIIQF